MKISSSAIFLIFFTISTRLVLIQASRISPRGIVLPNQRQTCFQSPTTTTPHICKHPRSRLIFSKSLSRQIYVQKYTTSLSMTPMQSLKPAAISLLEAGKAFARYGELIIDVSTTTTSYMGFSWKAFQMSDSNADAVTQQLSPSIAAMGACIRTAGDSIAQAGALMRFKTGHELLVVELRDASFSICHRLEENNSSVGSLDENNKIRSASTTTGMGVTSAWAKANEALGEINDMLKDETNNVVEWERARSVMVTSIPIYFKLGKQIEHVGVRIVENASADEVGRIFLDMSKSMEALSQVSPIFNKDKRDIWDECTLVLSKATKSLKDAGTLLGAKLDDDDNNINKGNGMIKSWIKNDS